MTRPNVLVGVGAIGFSCLVLFVWTPLDVTSGAFLEARRQHLIGDSFAPLVAGALIGLSGIMLVTFERKAPSKGTLSPAEIRFVAGIIAILALGLLAMSCTGPILLSIANWITGQELEYRLLRDEAPWKYIGYFTGGTIIVGGLMAKVHRQITIKYLIVGVISALVIAALLDLPFDDLLLPPNGDVT